MAHLGKMKPPVEPIEKAVERALNAIDCYFEKGVAVFMVGGLVTCSPKKSKAFDRTVERLQGNLVGIYDCGADPRRVKEDIAEFYK